MHRILSTTSIIPGIALLSTLIALVGCQTQAPTPPVVKQAITGLQSPLAKTRWQAAQKLGQEGPKAIGAATSLLKALNDPHWLVRAHAAVALPKLGDAVIPTLLKHLHTQNISYRQGGDKPLGRVVRAMQAKLLPHLLKRIRKQHGSARSWALAAITLIGPDALPLFGTLVQSKENALRAAVVRAYPALGAYATRGVPLLVKALDDPASYVRKLAASSLAIIGTKDPKIHARMLTQLRKDSDVRVKIKAAEALAAWRVTSAAAVGQLLDVLEAPSALTYFHFQLLRPLGQLTHLLGPKHPKLTARAVKLLIGLLQHRLSSMRFRAIEALRVIGTPAKAAVPTLLSMLGSKRHLTKLILRALGTLIDLSMLRQLTFHKDARYRTLAAMLLKHHLTKTAAKKQLKHLLKDPKVRVRAQLIQAIRAPWDVPKQAWTKGRPLAKGTALPRPSVADRRTFAGWLYPLATGDPNATIRSQALLTILSLHPLAQPTAPQQRAVPTRRPTPKRPAATRPTTTRPTTTRKAADPTSRPATKPALQVRAVPAKAAPKPTPAALGTAAWWDALLVQSLQGPALVQMAASRGIQDLKRCPLPLWQALQRAAHRTHKPKPLAALLQAMATCGPKQLSARRFKALMGHIQHERSEVRIAACAALGAGLVSANAAQQAQALLKLLAMIRTDASPDAAAAAARSVGALARGLSPQEKVSAATLYKVARGLLQDPSKALRKRGLALVAALPKQHQRPLVPKLLAILQRDAHAPCRAAAAGVLVGHRGEVSEALWGQALYDVNEAVRLQALDALKGLAPKIGQAIPALIALVWGQEVQTESRAIALLGHSKTKRAGPAIASRLRANAWTTRAHAARALGEIGPSPLQQEALQQARKDPHPQVRQAATHALSR